MFLLAFLMMLLRGPEYTVNPSFANEPATVTFLLLNIPEGARVACFALDGPNLYSSCKPLDGQHSLRVEYRDVYGGTYQTIVTVDKQQLPIKEVIIVKAGPE
jgi:hypothetical protein